MYIIFVMNNFSTIKIQIPTSKNDLKWIAAAYESIGVQSIPGYKENIDEALEQLQDWLSDSDSLVLIAADKNPAGMVIATMRNAPMDGVREAYIHALYISEEKRRKGLASLLLKKVHSWCHRKGGLRVKAFVATGNAGMIKLLAEQQYDPQFTEFQFNLPEYTNSESN